MPPKKTTTEETKQDQTQELNWQEVVDQLTQERAELSKRVEALENLIVGTSEFYPTTLLEDLDFARKFFAAAGKPAGERFLRHYTSARDLIGEKAQAIDRKLRGV